MRLLSLRVRPLPRYADGSCMEIERNVTAGHVVFGNATEEKTERVRKFTARRRASDVAEAFGGREFFFSQKIFTLKESDARARRYHVRQPQPVTTCAVRFTSNDADDYDNYDGYD